MWENINISDIGPFFDFFFIKKSYDAQYGHSCSPREHYTWIGLVFSKVFGVHLWFELYLEIMKRLPYDSIFRISKM